MQIKNKLMYHISRENTWNIGDILIAGEQENQFWNICKNYSKTVRVNGEEMLIFQMFDRVANFDVT